MAHHHRQPRHAYATTVGLVDNRRPAQHRRIVGVLLLEGLQEIVVDLEDNLQMTRQDFTQHIDRPGLQRFAHQGMVGIGEGFAGDCPGVVEVNRDFVRQVGVGFMQLVVAAEDVLHRR